MALHFRLRHLRDSHKDLTQGALRTFAVRTPKTDH